MTADDGYYLDADGMLHTTEGDIRTAVSIDEKLRLAEAQFKALDADMAQGMAHDPIAAAAAEAMNIPFDHFVARRDTPVPSPSWWTRNRSDLMKSVVYRLYSSVITFLISYRVTHDTTISLTIGSLDILKVVTYWGFDRMWNNLQINSGWWMPRKGTPTPFDHLQD